MVLDPEIKIICEILNEVIAGDLSRFKMLLSTDQDRLIVARNHITKLLLKTSGLLRVLLEFQIGNYDETIVQKWASLMRRGYVSSANKGPITPIEIEYQPESEGLIADILARLDDLGDTIDGFIQEPELEFMINSLKELS